MSTTEIQLTHLWVVVAIKCSVCYTQFHWLLVFSYSWFVEKYIGKQTKISKLKMVKFSYLNWNLLWVMSYKSLYYTCRDSIKFRCLLMCLICHCHHLDFDDQKRRLLRQLQRIWWAWLLWVLRPSWHLRHLQQLKHWEPTIPEPPAKTMVWIWWKKSTNKDKA